MKTEILKYLKEADGYVSGQELCERLGVSRTAVWKVMRQLEEAGYPIEAVRNRGYRLADIVDVLSKEEIESVLTISCFGRNLVFLKEVDSTNNEVRRMAEAQAPEGTLAVAEQQTGGKGRRGRSWTSPPGAGIWMSFLVRPEFPPESASMLTLVAAMAVQQGICQTTGLACMIKWPNDIVLNGKKICGILTEMSSEEDTIRYVVVGIGVNANIEQFPEDIRDKATSLRIESGRQWNRAQLINGILMAWEDYYQIYLKTLDMSFLGDSYNQNLVNSQNQVRVLASLGEYTGISMGINSKGELLVKREDGQIVSIMSGEVSVRGIYGYT